MKIKKLLSLLIILTNLLLFANLSYSTRIPFIWHVGFKVGPSISTNNNNFSDPDEGRVEISSEGRFNFSPGFYLAFTHKGAEYVNLQLELNYYPKGYKKVIEEKTFDPYQQIDPITGEYVGKERTFRYLQTVYLEYLGIPLILKLDVGSFFDWDDKVYFILGTGINILITGIIKQSDDVLNVYDYYERVEFDYQLGIGYNFLKIDDFHVFSELRLMTGLEEVNKVTNSLVTLNSFVCFYFGIDYLL